MVLFRHPSGSNLRLVPLLILWETKKSYFRKLTFCNILTPCLQYLKTMVEISLSVSYDLSFRAQNPPHAHLAKYPDPRVFWRFLENIFKMVEKCILDRNGRKMHFWTIFGILKSICKKVNPYPTSIF